MRFLFSLLTLVSLSVVPAQAQCKDCGCKAKCSPTCECKHDQKPEAQ
jgi:hypothetical protein